MSEFILSRAALFPTLCIAFCLSGLALKAEDFPLEEFGLTRDEVAWLGSHRTIRVGGPKAFPPFHYYDEQGSVQGIAADYVGILAEMLGVRIETLAARPWPEVLQLARDRQIDLIACAARTSEREAYLTFSLPYLSFPMVIISRKDAPFIGGLGDLHGKSVALVREVSTYEWLMRDGIAITPRFAGTPLEALQNVAMGDADAYIGNLAACSYLIDKNGLANLKIAAPTTYGNYDLHIAVRSDWRVLASIINKALQAMPPEQHSAIRNRWINVRYEYGLRAVDILKWVLAVAGVSALVIAGFVRWNGKLKKEIAHRKKAEDDLAKVNLKLKILSDMDGLTNIPNRRRFDVALQAEWQRATRERLPLALIMADIDFFKAYNDNHGHQAGDDCLKSVAATLEGSLKRPGDLIARYGGEEFVTLLPDTDVEGARLLAEAMRSSVADLAIKHPESGAGYLTVSLGLAAMIPERSQKPEQLVELADVALYKSKHLGRNQVQIGQLR